MMVLHRQGQQVDAPLQGGGRHHAVVETGAEAAHRLHAGLVLDHPHPVAQMQPAQAHEAALPLGVEPAHPLEVRGEIALAHEIGQGRPAGMHNRTFWKKSRELAQLEQRFAGGELPKASLAHQRRITPEWVRPCDLRGGLWLRNYRLENGVLVRRPEDWLD